MIGDVDGRFFDLVPDVLDLILDLQDGLAIHLAGRIPDPKLDRAGIVLLAIPADIFEKNALRAIPVHGLGSVKDPFVPAFRPAVQRVGPVVLGQGVRLAIEIAENAVLETIGHAADGRPEEGLVVPDIILLRGESLHDVVAVHLELLDDCSQREEGEGGFLRIRHTFCAALGVFS